MLQCTIVRRSYANARRVVYARAAVGLAGLLGLGSTALATAWQPELVAPGVYVLVAAADTIEAANEGRVANVAFVVGPRGVVVVDSGLSARQGRDVIDAVGRVTRQPIRLLILT